jgi:hypothetical protein
MAEELRAAANGDWLTLPDSEWCAQAINYESRRIRTGHIAVATDSKEWGTWTKRNNESLENLFERGAACVIVSRRPSSLVPGRPILLVDNTRLALDEIGNAARQRLKIPGSLRLPAVLEKPPRKNLPVTF